MSQPLDYPGDAPTGPHTAVLPDGHYQQAPQGVAYPSFAPPGAGVQQMPPAKPNRLNKVAAWIGIAAGSLVIVAVLFGSGFYLGRETAPQVPGAASGGVDQGGPMIVPMPRGQFERPEPGPGIVIPNGPTFQLPNIFPQFPMSPQSPTTQVPGQPPR
ncbi:hypothetical protein H7K45_17840 [Mycobacterium yunnanensis]|uniref:Uncharacterized protein n=1 Tax=Mycobacterium yunnanensis TaxID=368477 RepID=A0A9X2YN21_9MYCO|nr:hypothetical protein [Mycobacterium yunnanensis]MCV7422412.1 hypothetical protein [Mycobacterium yunnanensis]